MWLLSQCPKLSGLIFPCPKTKNGAAPNLDHQNQSRCGDEIFGCQPNSGAMQNVRFETLESHQGYLRPSAGRSRAKIGKIVIDEIGESVRAKSSIPEFERTSDGERSIAQHSFSHQICRHLSRTFFTNGRRAQEHFAPWLSHSCFRARLIFPL